MDCFYRRFPPLDVFLYAFGVKNDNSHRNLPSPKEAASNFAFETASYKSIYIVNVVLQNQLFQDPTLIFLDNVVSAALDDTRCGNESENSLFLKLRDSQSTAVAHC